MKSENKGITKGLLVSLLIVPVLVAIGVVAGSYITSSAGANEDGEGVIASKESAEEFTVPLEEFLVNLHTESGRNQYLSLEVSLSTENEESVEVVNSNLDKIRDAVIYSLNAQTPETVFEQNEDGFVLKKTLTDQINTALSDDLIKDVYITNIVMQ